ncbi:hypothetical protein IYZ83_002305 [Wolbachia pipientis]|uniref:hypothetical protein n=1 Tax=Wolbachia pipientis TaxID=955 RepID=UPI001F17BE44|nr:hypothetical protein [Wolbachia pipientis]UIP92041.1 hypothetical protein IYZ83_002305 [Wolbachia pipientis]
MQHLIEGLDSIDQVIIDIDLYKTNIAYFSLRTNCMCFKIRFFFEIYYHENSNFPFAAGLLFLNVFT